MKKITLLTLLLAATSGFAQCLVATNGQYPFSTFVPSTVDCDGVTVQNITTCGYASEYSLVTVTAGETYTFSSSIPTDIITISADGGTTAATFGTGTVTWVATLSGDIRFYTHLTGCGAESVCREKNITCGIPSTDMPDVVTLQSPASATIEGGATLTVSGQVYEAGLTDVTTGQAPGIQVWVGYNIANTDPSTWTNWTAATFNTEAGDFDEYQATIGAALTPGTYYYATRARLNNGPFVYGGIDANNVGDIWDGASYISGVLTITDPTNNNFATPIAISCGTVYTGNTSLATLDEDNAPDGFGADMDAPNLWYSFTGSGNAQTVTLDLCGSSYDTSVLIYTGTSGNLTLVGGNDDDTTCTSNTVNSKATFNSDGTTTYYIAVEGWNSGNTGAFTMNVTCTDVNPPAVDNQDCDTALTVQVDNADVPSDNSYATISATQPTCDLFGSIQDVWFAFQAPTSGSTIVTLSNGTMTSLNYAVYSGTCGALTLVGTCTSNSTTTNTQTLTGLTAGNTYYIKVLSNGSEQGTFTLRLADPSLGNNAFNSANFSYYPNPVKNVLNLSYIDTISNVEVVNVLGQTVLNTKYNANQVQVDLSTLANGAYMVKITSNNQVKTIKVIKQ
jgi:hypothetical protein